MEVDGSDEQNAEFAICGSFDSLLKLTFDKARHPQKQFSQMISTDEGIQIDESDEESPNAACSIRESLDSRSKLTLDRVRHS
jgi:hypothetical protein